MGSSIRVYENVVDDMKETSVSRGNLMMTSINLPRIGVKNGIKINGKADIEGFFKELDEKLEIVKEE